MTEHRHTRHLRRAVAEVTSGAIEGQQAADAEQASIGASHVAQQVQLPVSGKIGGTPTNIDWEVVFPQPFLMHAGPTQSDAMYDPHFNYGTVMQSDTPAILDCQVMHWIENDSRLVTGAKVRIWAWSPRAPKLVNVKAQMHLTFFGYAGPVEDDSEG